MASRGKKKTTMAKLSRESRLRERKVEKAMRKDARKAAAENPVPLEYVDDEFGLATVAPESVADDRA